MKRHEDVAAYTPSVGMKSLERKLMHNGERGADYFEPEWAEVRVVMRERDRLHRALDFIASDATIVPEGCPEPWRSTLIEWVQAANHALDGETT